MGVRYRLDSKDKGKDKGYKLVLEAFVLALTMAHVSLIWLFIVIITMLVSLSGSCVSVQTGMSGLEGNIYEPWIRWKSESESKSKRKKMQRLVIPEGMSDLDENIYTPLEKLHETLINHEGNIYEPWILWKSESKSKSASKKMQGPVISEGEEAKGMEQGQEMDIDRFKEDEVDPDIKEEGLESLVQSSFFAILTSSNSKMKPDFADVERDAFTEGIDTFNVPNVMKEADYEQLVENTGLKMNRDQESSSPSTFQSITIETFYQYMISLLLCYQVLRCWMTKNIMIVTRALKDLENNGVITQFPLLLLFSEVILESWFTGRIWVCSRVTRQFLLPPNFNEAIRLSEPLPNEDNPLQKKNKKKI